MSTVSLLGWLAGRRAGKYGCKEKEVELQQFWKGPECALDVVGEEEVRQMSRNLVLQVAVSTQCD